MTPQKYAERLLHRYRMVLMDDGEDFGEEILVSVLSKKMSILDINHSINVAEQINQTTKHCNKEIKFLKQTREIIEEYD